jgi:hypothetical protein
VVKLSHLGWPGEELGVRTQKSWTYRLANYLADVVLH